MGIEGFSPSPEERENERPPRLEIGQWTEAKEGRKGPNEDRVAIFEYSAGQVKVCAVFDGVGGYAVPALAAQAAEDEVRFSLAYSTFSNQDEALPQLSAHVKKALKAANKRVREVIDPATGKGGAGSTATMALLVPDGPDYRVVVGNIGDSRAYRLPVSGDILQITLDDSQFAKDRKLDESESRELQNTLAKIKDLDNGPEAADDPDVMEAFLDRNLIGNYLGRKETVPIRIECEFLGIGEALVLLSDGIHDNLTDDEITEIVRTHADNADAAAKALVAAAQARSKEGVDRSKKDDMTAVVVFARD